MKQVWVSDCYFYWACKACGLRLAVDTASKCACGYSFGRTK